MPLIEMSEVLTDPMFLDSFSVNRRTQLVDETGIASTGSTVFPGVFGVVYPSDKNDLSRLPDFQLQSKAITVITKFALRGESKTSGDGGNVVLSGPRCLERRKLHRGGARRLQPVRLGVPVGDLHLD